MKFGTSNRVTLFVQPCLCFLLKTLVIFGCQLCLKQFKLQLSLALLQFLQDGYLFLKLFVLYFLRTDSAAFKPLGGIDIASTELGKKETMWIVDWLAVSLLRSNDTGIRHVEEVLECPYSFKLIEIGSERMRAQILKYILEDEIL